MKIESNIDELINGFKKLAEAGKALNYSEALTVGVNAALGEMKFRIFNTGKDSKGVAFGKYVGKRSRVTNRKFKITKYGDPEKNKQNKKFRKAIKGSIGNNTFTEYEKKRLSQGRQIIYKDLEFTGSLRRAILVVVISENHVIAAIPNDFEYKKTVWQTQQISRILKKEVTIFQLSDDEETTLTTNVNEALSQLYERLFNS